MNVDLMIESIPALLGGLVVTVQLVAAALVVGFAIALPTALARISRHALLRWISLAYVFFFRGTPLLVQIFLIYYGLAQFEAVRESFLWPILRQSYWCALIAFPSIPAPTRPRCFAAASLPFPITRSRPRAR